MTHKYESCETFSLLSQIRDNRLDVKDGIAIGHEDLDIWVDVILKGGVSVGTKTWFVGFSYDVFRVVAG